MTPSDNIGLPDIGVRGATRSRGEAMTVKLPTTIAEYFAASNSDDANRVAACFANDAVVHDEGHDIRGQNAVRAWAEETRRKYRYHAEVVEVEEATDCTVVTARLTGEFPGSPIDLHYRFKLAGSKIIALEIG
jgi:ketosteroid isomerase-like protein